MNFWCARCGEHQVPERGQACEACRTKPRLEDFACGVCGERAAVMFVYGFRCDQHRDQREPSQMVQGPGIIGVVGWRYG